MEMIHGKTLEDEWEHLPGDDKRKIAKQLRSMVDALRLIKQGSNEPFIGHIGHQPLSDIIFEGVDMSSCPPGPFYDVSSFHDYLTRLPRPQDHRPGDPEHPLRPIFPDVFQLRFTHGDLNPRNILISTERKDGSPRLVAIVDWHQAGWLPEYWEYFKTLMTVNTDDEWAIEYVPLFLQAYHGFDYWTFFAQKGV